MAADGFRFSGTEIVGFVAGLLGSIVHVTDRSTRTVNGVETVLYQYDYAAAGFGAVAVLLGMKSMLAMQSRVPPLPRGAKRLHLLTSGVVALLGLVQMAVGVGLLRAL